MQRNRATEFSGRKTETKHVVAMSTDTARQLKRLSKEDPFAASLKSGNHDVARNWADILELRDGAPARVRAVAEIVRGIHERGVQTANAEGGMVPKVVVFAPDGESL